MTSLTLNQLSGHVYWLPPDSTTDRPVLGAIVGERGALLVDAGNSEAHAQIFLKELARLKIEPIYLVLTHWHWDHVFGTAAFRDLPMFAHIETKRVVTEMAGLDWRDEALDQRVAQGREIAFCRNMIKLELPVRDQLEIVPPDIAFTDQLSIDLGGVTCQIVHVGGDHAADAAVVFIPEDKVIFVADCLAHDIYDGDAYTTAKLFPLIDRLLAFEADYYLFGHGSEPMPRAELIEMTTEMRQIGQLADRIGPDQAALTAAVLGDSQAEPNEDQLFFIETFIAGLKRTA
jgi:glyoxylase-like metal-dependent hydrolase (beta-lactamase superfamily II)